MAFLTEQSSTSTDTISDQIKQFGLETAQYMVVAVGVNALLIYLLAEETFAPGLINGAASALSYSVVYKISKLFLEENSELMQSTHLGLLLVVNFFAVISLSDLLGYEPSILTIIKQSTFSYIPIFTLKWAQTREKPHE
ncbi:MAG: hypothetical protein K1060chlam2_00328 [Chlamydiae bacterium]|nr:hypothetical protein [Chlamydiota bacterium]